MLQDIESRIIVFLDFQTGGFKKEVVVTALLFGVSSFTGETSAFFDFFRFFNSFRAFSDRPYPLIFSLEA